MTLLQALRYANIGRTVISNAGRRYAPQELAPIWVTNGAAACSNAGMTDAERKGEWDVDERK
jgi:hypothetical protein